MSKRLFAALSVITLALTGCAADDEDEAAGVVEQSTGSEATTEHVVEEAETGDVENYAASDAITKGLPGEAQQDKNEEAGSEESQATPDEVEPQPTEVLENTGPVEAAPEPVETVEPVEPVTPPVQQDSADQFGETVINERGNLVKEIGQLAGLANPERNDEITAEFAITAIEPNFQCTSSYSDPPANGNYIAITFEVQTYPAMADSYWKEWYMSPYDLKIISSDGTRENDSIGNSYSCLSDADSLPTSLGPSERATGKIVLDSAYESGSLVLTVPSIQGAWEWQF